MNTGSVNDHGLLWENTEEWLFNLNDHQVGSGETFEGDKLPDLNRSDTCQPLTTVKEVAEAKTDDGKTRSPPNQKEDGNISGEPKSGADGGGGRGGESEHEIHIWTERERRKKMRSMFETLHALLPKLPAKADKSTIVDEAVNQIKKLQKTVERLENQKLERLQQYSLKLSKLTSLKLSNVGNSWEQFLADQGSTSNSAAITPTINNNNNNNISATPLLMNNNIPIIFETWSSPNVILNICGEDAHISVCCPKKSDLFSFICYVLEKHKIEIVSAQISSDHFRSMFMIQAHAKGGSSFAQFSEAFTMEEMYKKAANEIMSLATPK